MSLVLGVIGHVDHGKTALIRALTGTDTDRLAEEKRRGISIVLGFAHLAAPGGTIHLVDTPGHERFVRTMTAGATGMDAALLAVDAREGIMPQTREHLDIAALLGITRAIIAVTKCDLPDSAPAETAASAEALLRTLGITPAATILTSTVTGDGILALREALTALLATTEHRAEDDGFFYLPVDRAFTLPGQGTIVTGTLRRGPLAISAEAELLPGRLPIRLRALQVNGARLTTAQPGQRVAANLRDIEPSAIGRGAVLASRGAVPPASLWLGVHLQATASAPPLSNGALFTLLTGTTETEARLRLLGRDTLGPGESAFAQLRLATPLPLPARERFILRRVSPPLTVAGGIVLDPSSARLRRANPPPGLTRLLGATPAAILLAARDEAGPRGLALTRLAALSGLSPSRAAALAAATPGTLVTDGMAFPLPCLDALRASVLAALPAEGATAPAIARALAEAPPGQDPAPALLSAALEALTKDGALRLRDGLYLRPDAARDRSAEDALRRAASTLLRDMEQAGLSPPDIPPATRRIAQALVRAGALVQTLDTVQRREIFFHKTAIEAAKRKLAPHLAPPGLLVGEAGRILGISRKYSVPLMEHFDAVHFTKRIADRRILAQ